MTTQGQQGTLLRDEGMARASAHAGRRHSEWAAKARLQLITFLAMRGTMPFMAEDVRLFATAQRFPPPPDARAWGAVLMSAARAKLIRKRGYGPSKRLSRHHGPNTIWVIGTGAPGTRD